MTEQELSKSLPSPEPTVIGGDAGEKFSLLNMMSIKQWLAGALFLVLALWLGQQVPTIEIAWVVAILLFTVFLFAFEVVSVDVAAATVMVLLGLSSILAPVMGLQQGLVDNQLLFNGFSSNAVISIIAVMIIGAGLDKTGLMSRVAKWILDIGGETESRVISITSSTVAFISCFMQNVGAAALFIPVVSRISRRTGLPLSRLLMPMGFSAILGGTMTMIGSSPLILLNDLILAANLGLPEADQMATWSLFSVTPIGIALVATGILYFLYAGNKVLPKSDTGPTKIDTVGYFQDMYGLDHIFMEVFIPAASDLVGQTLEDFEYSHGVRVIGVQLMNGKRQVSNGLVRTVAVEGKSTLAVSGSPTELLAFVEKYQLKPKKRLQLFAEDLSTSKAGIAEIVVPPGSNIIGKTALEILLRKAYGLTLLALQRGGETYKAGQGVRAIEFEPGDVLVCHTSWENLVRTEQNRNFVVVTTDYPKEELRPKKVGWAVGFFVLALAMVLFSDIRLSVALMAGALGMVLSGVLSIDEAYEAVSWKTVFLLASLLPLGMAVQSSGTAAWIADQSLQLLAGVPVWGIQLAIAILATAFTLVMSNVGATVLLVPLAVNMAIGVGANPAVFALIVALATSNSFLIPTHQVNALIMGPGGYRVMDFIRAGSIMTLLYLVVLISAINLIF